MDKKEKNKSLWTRCKDWMSGLSFRTGVIVLAICVPCYIFAFAQAALPISIAWKGILWTVFFGLAKTFQYGGLLILGKEGMRRLKQYFKKSEIEKRRTQ